MKLPKQKAAFKDFLSVLKGDKIAMKRKDDNKSKSTSLFWLEDGEIMPHMITYHIQ